MLNMLAKCLNNRPNCKALVRLCLDLFVDVRYFANAPMLKTLERCGVRSKVSYHTSQRVFGLEEFFDTKENWGAFEVKVGRSWKKEELRLKSHDDLHKLWYVLLKEKNMLLTMERASKDQYKAFPNPERIDKVEDSMKNIEEVVKERNKAYWLLETGEIGGERPHGPIVDTLGRHMTRQFIEFPMPDHLNPRYRANIFLKNPIPNRFYRLLKEQEYSARTKKWLQRRLHVAKLFSYFPDIDVEALQKKYPDIDVHHVRRLKEARGNHDNNQS